MISIQIPASSSSSMQQINLEKNLIIVGANWSWKTRFGSRIEQSNSRSKRISAQRYLQLTEIVPKQDYETASTQFRESYRNQSVIQPQNDYQQAMISLFAEENKRNELVIEKIKSDGNLLKEDLPLSIKEKVITIWNFIFPYRQLNLKWDKVRAINNWNEFPGTEMSDGEKVALYLISQVLLVEENWILIIDEPELHLHKALMVRLWNRLEEERKDCTFIYITHDLDFAVSKTADQMIWIKGYSNNSWEWELLESNNFIPENLYLEILGSRKPILFIEWDKWSLDIQVYQSVYPDFTIIPCPSCEKVIEAVKWLSAHLGLHDKKIYWIIDKDFRPDEQLWAYESIGIFHTKVNEIENIFLTQENIELVCSHLWKSDKITEIINKIKEIYLQQKENIKFRASKFLIHRKINESLWEISWFPEYETWKTQILWQLDGVTSLLTLPDETDLYKILEFYPHKWLVRQIQSLIELNGNGYQNLVLNFFTSDKRNSVVENFKKYLPTLPTI